MIEFQVLQNGEKFYISWSSLCQWTKVKWYMPSPQELIFLKQKMAETRAIPLDDVQVLVDGSPTL